MHQALQVGETHVARANTADIDSVAGGAGTQSRACDKIGHPECSSSANCCTLEEISTARQPAFITHYLSPAISFYQHNTASLLIDSLAQTRDAFSVNVHYLVGLLVIRS
jgi:hypothetical protein